MERYAYRIVIELLIDAETEEEADSVAAFTADNYQQNDLAPFGGEINNVYHLDGWESE